MRMGLLAKICILAMCGLGLSPSVSPASAMTLGVATHFAQGWPIGLLRNAQDLGTRAIRDDISWQQGEPSLGHYDPAHLVPAYLRDACRKGFDVLLVIDPRRPDYEGGKMVASADGQAAFARYAAALLDRVPARCVSGLEVGNEINSNADMMGADEAKTIEAYARLLHVLRDAIHAKHPDVAIVGGSTNMIGTGFLTKLMDAGAFDAMDAVAVHPYRSIPENVDLELARLTETMRRHGVLRPIWVTEFGDYFPRAELAPPHLIKMAMLLAAAGVDRAYWYALQDEPWFANMGLYDKAGARKPSADAFALTQRDLLRGGAPKRVDQGDRRSFVFQLASGGYVLWGDSRPIRFDRFISATDSRGAAVERPDMLTEDPVVLPAGTAFSLGQSAIVADSLLDYGDAAWSYGAQKPGDRPIALAMRDSRWTSSYFDPALDPLTIGASSLTPAGEGNAPTAAVVRYTAPYAQNLLVSACFAKKVGGDGVAVHVSVDDKPVFDTVVTERSTIDRLAVALPARGRLAFAFSAAGRWGNEDVSYRIRLTTPSGAVAPACIR